MVLLLMIKVVSCMLENFNNMLEKAKNGKYAIPHFNINNCEWAKYILEECNELQTPVIIGVSESAVKYMGGYNTVSKMIEGLIIDLKITIPVCLHLDHGSCFKNCKKAIDAGFSSVMIDASKENIQENIKITSKTTEYAHKKGVSVEAELGYIGTATTQKSMKNTTAEQCVEFYNATKIDALAPALGSIHGLYKKKPNLDFKTMNEIKHSIPIPIVLHGGTGIPELQLKKAISCGISKININTDLQVVWSKDVRKYLKYNKKIYDPRKIISSGEKAIKKRVKEIVTLCRNTI